MPIVRLFNSAHEPGTIAAAREEWLVFLKKFEHLDNDTYDFCASALREFNRTMELAWLVTAIDEVEPLHIGFYYSVTHKMVLSAEWAEAASEACGRQIDPVDMETFDVLSELKLSLLRDFFSFCCAQGYVGTEVLNWSWEPDDLERWKERVRAPS